MYKSLNWATRFGLRHVLCRSTATQVYDQITVSLTWVAVLTEVSNPPPSGKTPRYGGVWGSVYAPHVPAGFSPISSAFSHWSISILQVTNGGLFLSRIVMHTPGPGVHAWRLSPVSQAMVRRWTPVYIVSRRFRQMPSVFVSWRSVFVPGAESRIHNFLQTQLVLRICIHARWRHLTPKWRMQAIRPHRPQSEAAHIK
jgi:hypothetical protein